LPQHDWLAQPAPAGGLIGCHRKFEIFNPGDVLEDLAVCVEPVDPEGEMSARRQSRAKINGRLR
jgi:hypothetical protein